MFDITWVGLPCAVMGLVYMLIFSRWLLPEQRSAIHLMDKPREYTVEMLVDAGSSLVGQTIEQAGLRHLQGVFLMQIDRGDQILAAVSPPERLKASDQLIFVGIAESVANLPKTHGLIPASDKIFTLNRPRTQRCLIEAIVSNTCPLVGQTIHEDRFRTVYNAVVIAVARNGERLGQKVGDIVLRSGDTLLLETYPSFVNQQRNFRDFFLVSQVKDFNPPRHNRAWMALAFLIGMVFVVTMG